jgi:hypothetical protein
VVVYEYQQDLVPLPAECPHPVAVYYPQMAWFQLDPPLADAGDDLFVGDESTLERGFVLAGGETVKGGAPSAAVWIYDLRATGCPWIQQPDLPAGRSRGALLWFPAERRMRLVGGRVALEAGWETNNATFHLDFDSYETLATGWQYDTEGPANSEFSVFEASGFDEQAGYYYPICAASAVASCVDPSTGDVVERFVPDPCSATDLLDCPGDPGGLTDSVFLGCLYLDGGQPAGDPHCVRPPEDWAGWAFDAEPQYPLNPTGALARGSAAGRAEPAVTGVGGAYTLHGGSVGCNAQCGQVEEILSLDRVPRSDGGRLAAHPGAWTVTEGAVTTEDDIADPRRDAGFPLGEGVVTGATQGVWGAAGVTLGLDWDRSARAVTGESVELVVGGSRYQQIAAELQWNAVMSDVITPTLEIYGVIEQAGSWSISFYPWYDADDGLVDDRLTWYWDPLARAYEEWYYPGGPLAWNAASGTFEVLGDRFYGAAAVAVEADAWLLVGGTGVDGAGVPFAERSEAWVVDDNQGKRARIEPGIGREGAGIVFDPVTQAAFVFGGSSSTALYTIYAPDNRVVPDIGSSWTSDEIDLQWTYGIDGLYRLTETLTLTHACEPVVVYPPDPFEDCEPDVNCPPMVPPELDTTDGLDHRNVPAGQLPDCFASAIEIAIATSADAAPPGTRADAKRVVEEAVVRQWIDGVAYQLVALDDAALVSDPLDPAGWAKHDFAGQGTVWTRRFLLARDVPDAESVELTVGMNSPPAGVVWSMASPGFGVGDTNFGGFDPCRPLRTVQALRGVPAWATGTGELEALGYWESDPPAVNTERHVGQMRVVGQYDELLLPGEPIECGGQFGAVGLVGDPAAGSCSAIDAPVAVMQGQLAAIVTDAALVEVPSSDLRVRVHEDACLIGNGMGVGGSVDTWASAAGSASDVTWLEDRLGPLPTSVQVVALPGPIVPGLSGHTRSGISLVYPFDTKGAIRDYGVVASAGAEDWRGTAVHEIAHQWLGIRAYPTGDAAWVAEAMPTEVQLSRYPAQGLVSTWPLEGMSFHLGKGSLRIWDPALDDPFLQYEYGAVLLAAAHHVARGLDPQLTDDDVWVSLRGDAGGPGLWQGAEGLDELDVAVLVAELEDLAPGFWDEWIDAVVTPVVAIGGEDLPDADADGFPEAVASVALASDGTGTLRVRQIQVDGFGLPLATIPWALGCQPLHAGDAVFEECDTDGVAQPIGIRLLFDEEQALTLSGATPGAAVRLALLGPQHLFPEVIGRVGILPGDTAAFGALSEDSPATWLLYCPPGNTDPECTSDLDLDGAPDLGDCWPFDPSRHPEAEDPPYGWAFDPAGFDLNCDGWPNAAVFPP